MTRGLVIRTMPDMEGSVEELFERGKFEKREIGQCDDDIDKLWRCQVRHPNWRVLCQHSLHSQAQEDYNLGCIWCVEGCNYEYFAWVVQGIWWNEKKVLLLRQSRRNLLNRKTFKDRWPALWTIFSIQASTVLIEKDHNSQTSFLEGTLKL